MLFRFIAFLFAIILIIPLLRSIIGIIMRGFADLLKSESTTPQKARQSSVPATGELRKDPVCGTYVSTATALKKTRGDETVYFCSQDCLQRYSS